MTELEQLAAAITALEAQRAVLGNAVADAAIGPLRERLAVLQGIAAPPPSPHSPPEQALKQVTVLFLDIVGSTALSQHLDPEEIHAVMDGALDRCTQVVRAHGGRVLQYAGDNLLAAFGTPQAQEDDAERAVRCGLALLTEGRALGERVLREHGQSGCDVRVGIHTGPVLLGGGVDDESTIRGLTVNVAARMEQTAPAGALRISRDTWLLVRGVFDMDEQPPLVVKGRDEPLVTYLVQRAKPRAFRIATHGIDGAASVLVGRHQELQRLRSALDQVAAGGTLQAFTLLADPGLGKSRLLHEAQALLEAHPQRFWLLLGRAHPQGRMQPYGLLRDLLAWRLQIADSDTADTARAKLVEGLAPWFAADAEQQAHRIGQLIGLDFTASPHVRGIDPPLLRRLAFATLMAYLRALAADGSALAVLLEDLHWADDGSLDFLDHLLREGAGLPLLLIATARPTLQDRRADWASGHPAHQLVALATLDAADGELLARALLARVTEGAEALQALLVSRADGNPFYMEELVRMLLDDGVIAVDGEHWRLVPGRLGATRIPTTLVGVLQARLDALPAADRQALQQASILGYVFWDDALRALDPRAPAAVPALQGKALIRQRDSSAFEGTPEEAFHHHLLQQVTYDTVLKPARRAGHAAAAEWLAERVGSRSTEYLAVTADHYERAGDAPKALEYLERAALDAKARFVNQAALDLVARALASPALTDPRRRARLLTTQENVADVVGLRPLMDAALRERRTIAEALDDDAMRADIRSSEALLASRRGDDAEAFQLATEALAIAERCGAAEVAALAEGQLAWSLYCEGQLDAARAHVLSSLGRVRGLESKPPRNNPRVIEVQSLTMLSIIEEAAGHPRESKALALQALALSREHGLRRPEIQALHMVGSHALRMGRYAEAHAHLEAAMTAARGLGAVLNQMSIGFNIATCQLALGDRAGALVRLAECAATAQRGEHRQYVSRAGMLSGHIHAMSGDATAARAAFDAALADFEAHDEAPLACQARARLADWHLAHGEHTQAAALADCIEADLAAGLSLKGIDDVLWPRLACWRVRHTMADARAAALLDALHTELMAEVQALEDEADRRSVLENIEVHRQIMQAFAARPASQNEAP